MTLHWLRWLTYAHDPVAHERLTRIEALLTDLATRPVVPGATPLKVRETRRLDCGHEAASWATTSDGLTECDVCYRWRVRQQAHDPLFTVARTDDGWMVRGRQDVVAGPYDVDHATQVAAALNAMAGSRGKL